MEDYVIILTIGMIGVFSLLGMKMFKPNEGVKRAKREVQDSAQKEVIASKDMTISTMQQEMRRINGKLARFLQLEPELDEDELENGGKQVTWDEIQTLAKTQFPKQAMLLPLMKKQIMEATKGMSMEEILNYVKQFTENKQSPPGDPASISQGYNPNYA